MELVESSGEKYGLCIYNFLMAKEAPVKERLLRSRQYGKRRLKECSFWEAKM